MAQKKYRYLKFGDFLKEIGTTALPIVGAALGGPAGAVAGKAAGTAVEAATVKPKQGRLDRIDARNKRLDAKSEATTEAIGDVGSDLLGAGVNLATAGSAEERKKAGMGALKSVAKTGLGLLMEDGGQLTEYEAGGTHDENPRGGIPIEAYGAKVEEGETKTSAHDYVFSDKLRMPGDLVEEFGLNPKFNDLTFAEASKKINKRHNKVEREGDRLSQEAEAKDLEQLMNSQEAFKVMKDIEDFDQAMALGGFIKMETGGYMMMEEGGDSTKAANKQAAEAYLKEFWRLNDQYKPDSVVLEEALIERLASGDSLIDAGVSQPTMEALSSYMQDYPEQIPQGMKDTFLSSFASPEGKDAGVKQKASAESALIDEDGDGVSDLIQRPKNTEISDGSLIADPASSRIRNQMKRLTDPLYNINNPDRVPIAEPMEDAEPTAVSSNPKSKTSSGDLRDKEAAQDLKGGTPRIQAPVGDFMIDAEGNTVFPEDLENFSTPANSNATSDVDLTGGAQEFTGKGPNFGEDGKGPNLGEGDEEEEDKDKKKKINPAAVGANVLRFAPLVGSIANLNNLKNNKPTPKAENMFDVDTDFEANLVNRDQYKRDIEQESASARAAIGNASGGSRATVLSNLAGANERAMNALGATDVQADMVDQRELARVDQITNRSNMFNSSMKERVTNMNDADAGTWQGLLLDNVSNLTNNAGQVGTDLSRESDVMQFLKNNEIDPDNFESILKD